MQNRSANQSLDARLAGDGIDASAFFIRERRVVERVDVLQDLLWLRCADEDGRQGIVTEIPSERHFCERLPSPLRQIVQRCNGIELVLCDGALREETAVLADSRVFRDAVEVLVAQQPLCERAEGYDALPEAHGRFFEAVLLDRAVEEGIAVLVDDEGAAELVEDCGGFFHRWAVIIRQAGVERFA